MVTELGSYSAVWLNGRIVGYVVRPIGRPSVFVDGLHGVFVALRGYA